LGLTFFGLTSEYRAHVFSTIHEIVFWGKGGYDHDTIYDMPVWLRNFTFNKLKDHYQKNNSQDQETNIQKSISTMKQAKTESISPQRVPTYVTKASSKK